MSDADNDPSRIRRTPGQRVRAVVFLILCIAATIVMAEANGWTDWRGWWRRTCVEFSGGPARPRVKEGMTQAEVREVLQSDGRREGTFVTVGGSVAPGASSGQLPLWVMYPKPFFCVEYPEYSFDVVYHGKFDEPQDEWKVVAVEDRK